MSGIILNLVPRTDFDFTNLTLNTTTNIWLAQNIDASQYTEASLAVRLHAATITGGGANPQLDLALFQVAPTAEDPAAFFRDGSAKLTLTPYAAGSPTVPLLKVGSTTSAFWGLLSLRMSVKQWGGSVTAHSFTLSVDLNLKY